MARRGSRQATWIDGPHGVVELSRGLGADYEVIDPTTEQVIFIGKRAEARAFALGDTGHVIEIVQA